MFPRLISGWDGALEKNRKAYFPESAVHAALDALFPEPDPSGARHDSSEDFEFLDPDLDWPKAPDDEPIDPLTADWELPAYESSPEDLAEYAAWSEALERQRAFIGVRRELAPDRPWAVLPDGDD